MPRPDMWEPRESGVELNLKVERVEGGLTDVYVGAGS